MSSDRYIIIMPARNEEALLIRTLESLAEQTLVPAACVVVNDGSSDATGQIAERFRRAHDWLTVVHRPDRGCRMSGGGVMEAFADGFKHLGGTDWDFLVKLDADLSFEPDYFQRCMIRFDDDPQLGIGGGQIRVLRDGRPVVECPGDPIFHVRGATKIYRRACWDQIGGLVQSTGWDTIDELMANQRGWKTYTFKDIGLIQHRETGRAEPRWRDYVKNGRANYLTGYHPLFMFLKCMRRLLSSPLFVMSLGLGWGFTSASVRRMPRPVSPSFVKYVRQQQINRILGRNSIWN
jgi:poly-beta-1,6-N-acetyl-D-glucosamine synthase